jgi:hypothetical protein
MQIPDTKCMPQITRITQTNFNFLKFPKQFKSAESVKSLAKMNSRQTDYVYWFDILIFKIAFQ